MRSFAMSFNDSRVSVVLCAPPVGRNHIHTRHWRASDAAAFITILVVLGFAATMFLTRTGGAGLGMFTFEHVRFLDMVDTSSQRLAHRVALVLLAMLCALGAATITRPSAHVRQVTEFLRATHEFFKKWSGAFGGTAFRMSQKESGNCRTMSGGSVQLYPTLACLQFLREVAQLD